MNLRDWDATSSRFFHESTKWTLKKRMHHLFALFFESEHKCWWLQKDRDDGSGDTSRSESVSSFLKRSRAGSIWCKAAMGLDGMEAIAIAVVIGLFIVVLKQFGIWEPLSLEGNVHRCPSMLVLTVTAMLKWCGTAASSQLSKDWFTFSP